MRRILKIASISLATIAITLVIGSVAFDRLVVIPALEKANALLATAAPSERELPNSVKSLLLKSPGDRTKFSVARILLTSPPDQIASMRTTRRQFTEYGVGLLLPLHLDENDVLALYASQAYMGPGVRGFSQAAMKYVDTPLIDVSALQAAKLIAISRAPAIYLNSSERLEKMAQRILNNDPD